MPKYTIDTEATIFYRYDSEKEAREYIKSGHEIVTEHD